MMDVWRMLALNNSVNNFTQMRATWHEMRNFGIDFALEALNRSEDINDQALYDDIVAVIQGRLHNVSAPNLNDGAFKRISNHSAVFHFCEGRYTMQLNASNGAIGMLYDKTKGRQYADGRTGHNLGQFWWQFLNESLKGTEAHISLPNVYITTELVGLFQSVADESQLVLEMRFGDDANLCANYSCVDRVYNEVQFDCEAGRIEMDLKLINKTLTRIPETLYFSFVPYMCRNWSIATRELRRGRDGE